MAPGKLSDNLRKFYDEIDGRLEGLPPVEQQQYLEGMVHAFDAMTKYAAPQDVTPFGREEFIGASKSFTYSRTHHLDLDPESNMRELIENDSKGVAGAYAFAATLHGALGIPLDFEQQMTLDRYAVLCDLERMNED